MVSSKEDNQGALASQGKGNRWCVSNLNVTSHILPLSGTVVDDEKTEVPVVSGLIVMYHCGFQGEGW